MASQVLLLLSLQLAHDVTCVATLEHDHLVGLLISPPNVTSEKIAQRLLELTLDLAHEEVRDEVEGTLVLAKVHLVAQVPQGGEHLQLSQPHN